MIYYILQNWVCQTFFSSSPDVLLELQMNPITILGVSAIDHGLPRWISYKESACPCRRCKMKVQYLGQEDPLEKDMATYSSILAWRIPWTEEFYSL